MSQISKFSKTELNRVQGLLLGLHTGDSLGVTLEFELSSNPDNFHTEIIGGGRMDWPKGAPSDDTDLAMCILRSIVFMDTFDLSDIANRFVAWMNSGPVDIGNTTRSALIKLKKGYDPRQSGLTDEHSLGNGSLMRCAPLAILNLEGEKLKEITSLQAGITHANSLCRQSDWVLVRALKRAISGYDKFDIFNLALQDSLEIAQISDVLEAVPSMAWEDLECSGYVLDTLVAPFWALYHCNSFEEAIIKIVNRGNDADTCGAVTGALCGAYWGVAEIPTRWLETLELLDEITNLIRMTDRRAPNLLVKLGC